MTSARRSRAPAAAALEFARAIQALLQTSLLFRFGGSAAVARATAQLTVVPDPHRYRRVEPTREELSRSLRAIQRAKALWPIRVECLQTSLVLCGLYRRRSIPARVVVGVRMASGELVSHAWVDVNGIAIDDSRGSAGFAEFVGNDRPWG